MMHKALLLLLLLLLRVADVAIGKVCGMGISMHLHIGVIVSFIFDFIANKDGLVVVVVHGLCMSVNWQACVCECRVCEKLK